MSRLGRREVHLGGAASKARLFCRVFLQIDALRPVTRGISAILSGLVHMPFDHLLERRQVVPQPRSAVAAFFERPENLERLTPTSLSFCLLSPSPVPMQVGTTIEYRIRLRGLPMDWRSRIDEYEPGVRFVDVQERGPYAIWRHLREFEDVPEGTEIRDRIDYRLPLGPLGELAHAVFVRSELERIFDYRANVVAALFGAA